MTDPDLDGDWAALGGCDGAPVHQDEIMAAHGGQPSPEVQDRSHGAGKPAVDNGPAPGTVVG